jgi:hypothetical protein
MNEQEQERLERALRRMLDADTVEMPLYGPMIRLVDVLRLIGGDLTSELLAQGVEVETVLAAWTPNP